MSDNLTPENNNTQTSPETENSNSLTFPTEDEVREALKEVVDPEILMNVVELGLIYEIKLKPEEKAVDIAMTLTSPGCPLGPEMTSAVYMMVMRLPGVENCKVDLVWEPMWDPMVNASEEARMALNLW